MSSSPAPSRLRRPFLVALLLVVGGLVVCVPGCGDDDPVSPGTVNLLPNLATADSAAVTLHILGAVQYRDAEIYLEWMDINTRLAAGAYDDSSAVFHGEQVVTTERSSARDSAAAVTPQSGTAETNPQRSTASLCRPTKLSMV